MHFKIKCCEKGNRKATWWEEFHEDTPSPMKWAKETLRRFNATLRPGEKERELLDVVIIDAQEQEHNWHKTNLVTIMDRNGSYDAYRCQRCGITAKRFGLGEIIRDQKYKAEKYRRCIPQ